MELLDTTKYFKPVKFLLPLAAIMLLFTYCSPTETITEPEPPEVDVEESVIPDWFDSRITSREDSIAFYGYSHASAADSSEAVELSEKMARENLRFQIDKFSENKRISIVESGSEDPYRTPGFIIQLRNSIQEIDLSNTDIVLETYREENGIFHAFTEMKAEKEYIIAEISTLLNDQIFTDKLSEL